MTNAFLVGKKTILRPVTLADVPLVTEWINNPVTRNYLYSRTPKSDIGEKTWVEKIGNSQESHPSDIVMMIETKRGGHTIGTMGLHGINWIDRHVSTGSMIGNPEYRGKGYASDAKMAVLKYAFETLGMHKVISHAFEDNTASVEYSKRCGYIVEGVLKEQIFHSGVWKDLIVLACFYPDWKKAQSKVNNKTSNIRVKNK